MGSSRLPGKVMKEICGKPLIGHMLERLAFARRIDKVMLATSVDPANDPLADYVKSLGHDVFRGSEDNVLERFYLSATPHQPRAVIRLTGDCVLIDAGVLDRVIDVFFQSGADYAWADSTFAEGLDVEVFSYDALKAMYEEATLQSELEHVTQYIHKNAHRFKRVPVVNDTDDSGYRIVVDEPQDFDVACRIIEHFQKVAPGRYYDFAEVKAFLNDHPEIMGINTHIVRNEGLIKSLAKDKKVR